MASAKTGPPVAPRVSKTLERVDATGLVDEAAWSRLEVSGSFRGRARDVDISECHFRATSLSGVELERVHIADAVFDDCDLSGAIFHDAVFNRVSFLNCRLSGAVLSGGRMRDVTATSCKLDGVNFRMTHVERLTCADCILREADFYAASLAGVRFFDCDLTSAEFSKVSATDVALNGSLIDDLSGAEALRGVIIDSGQIIPFALRIFAALGIRVDDER